MPTPYDDIRSQYEQLFNTTIPGNYSGRWNPDLISRARGAFTRGISAGVDPSILKQHLDQLVRVSNYYSPSMDIMQHNTGQSVTAFENVIGAAERMKQAGLDPATNTGLLATADSTTGKQAIEEMITRQAQLNQQNQQLETFRNQQATQYFGKPNATLQEALASTSGDIGQMNQFLGEQQSRTFQRDLAPLINMQMGARGLQDSGANIELQSKALGQLEQSRQQSMMQAALGARQQIAGLGREDILGDIGARQQSLTDAFGLQRAGITMQFQRELEDQRERLSRELSARNGGGPGTLQQVLGGIGMAGSIAAAPFTGGMSLTALPAFANYGFGSEAGMLGAGAAGMGQGFFRNDTRSSAGTQSNPYEYMRSGRTGAQGPFGGQFGYDRLGLPIY